MSKQAFYHQDSKAPLLLDVIRKNDDGTLDLGKDEVTLVASCEVADEPAPGFATFELIKPEAKKPAK